VPALSFELVADDVSTGEVDGGVTVSEPYEEAVLVFEDVLHVVDAMAALFGPDMEAEAGPGADLDLEAGSDGALEERDAVGNVAQQVKGVVGEGDSSGAKDAEQLAEASDGRDGERGTELCEVLDAVDDDPAALGLEAQQRADPLVVHDGSGVDEARENSAFFEHGRVRIPWRGRIAWPRQETLGRNTAYTAESRALKSARVGGSMLRSPRNAWIAVLVFALVAGFLVTGHYLYQTPIGLYDTAFFMGEFLQKVVLVFVPDLQNSAGGGVLLLLSLLAIGAFSFFVVRHAVRAKSAELDPGRRTFLTGAGSGIGAALGGLLVGGAAAAARGVYGVGQGNRGWRDITLINDSRVAFTHPEYLDSWKGARVNRYRRLGRTNFEVSDIVLGTGRIAKEEGGERIAREAIDRGVNYFDTSPDYSGAGSEEVMGRAIKGVRDKLFVATKFCMPTGHLPPGTPVADYKAAVEASLKRLGTDYVDLCHIHSCDDLDRLMDPNVHEAFDRLKEEGKVRFLGVSTHTPNLVAVANQAIDSGRFDVMMLAYHHGIWPPLAGIITQARKQQDMGIVAMKTLKGAKHHGLAGFREHVDSYAQAALRWTLSNEDVSCAVISFFKLQHVDEYLAASGGRVSADDLAVLEKYDREIRGSYCSPHCGVCLDSCPEGLPIHDVLRHRMYFEDYGWEKEGIRLYAKLGSNASVCASCSAPCLGACPAGIVIQERMIGAHELLTLS